MIYGPFTVLTHAEDGSLTDQPAPGVHYTTDAGFLQTHSAVLSAYVVEPAHPLQYVMAGDDPANPQFTVAICFPDQATADQVVSQLVQL